MMRSSKISRAFAGILRSGYMPLVVLAAATVIGCAVLSQRIASIHADQLRESKVWTGRTNDYVGLRGLAAAVNSATDEKAASKDPGATRERIDKAIAALEAKLPPLTGDLAPARGGLAADIRADVEKIVEAARALTADARRDAAAQRQDKDLKDLNAAITVVTTRVRAATVAAGDASLGAAERLEAWQWRVAIATVPIMVVLGVLGYTVSRRLGRSMAEAQASRASAEAALREMQTLQGTIDQHAIVSATDATGRIIYANDQFCRISGHSREALLGKTHAILNSGVHSRDFWAGMWRTVASGQPWHGEVCNKSRDGSLYWVDTTIAPFRNSAGGIEKYVSIRTDITERKGTEESLRHMAQIQEEMGRIAGVGGWELDPATGRSVWTDEIYEIFEVPRSHSRELTSSLAFFPGEARDIVAGHIARAAQTGEGFDYTLPFVTAKGRNLWVRGLGKAERRPDGSFRLYGAFQDVTESHRASQELIAARDAARVASHAKSEFLANMSHEIRTPLTAILGYADLLREDGDLASAPKRRIETIDTIVGAGQHLLTVINDILDLSKIEADKMTVESIGTHPARILDEVATLMRPRAAAKGLTLTVRLATPVPECILGDPTRLRQILMNLVGNAAKFTECGGVTITARAEGSDADARLIIDVEDTGPGMTPEQAARMFSAFGQADATVTRKHGGTGLGLTISRRLATIMGGDVKLVRTEPEKGSCFRLILPLIATPGAAMISDLDAARAGDRPLPAPVQARLSGRILLAEDGVDNQRLIALLLRKGGAEIEIAENGRIALEKLGAAEAAGRPFDLLLTDMQMPVMDGYTLARTLRERGSTLAIVALTAHAMAEDHRKCVEAGCDGYASKPIEKAALLAMCAAWMGRPSGRAAAAGAAAAA